MTLRKFSAPSQVWGNIPSQQTLCYQFPAEICLDCVHGTLHEDFGARANKNCSNQFKPAFPVTAISLGQRRSPCESWCLYYTLLCNSFLSSLPVFPSVPASWTWNVGNSQPKSMKINILPASWISNAEQIFCGTPSLGAPACSLQSAVCKCHTPQNQVSQPKSHIGKPFTMREWRCKTNERCQGKSNV